MSKHFYLTPSGSSFAFIHLMHHGRTINWMERADGEKTIAKVSKNVFSMANVFAPTGFDLIAMRAIVNELQVIKNDLRTEEVEFKSLYEFPFAIENEDYYELLPFGGTPEEYEKFVATKYSISDDSCMNFVNVVQGERKGQASLLTGGNWFCRMCRTN